MVRAILASFTYRPVQRWGPVSPHGVGTAVGFLAGAMLMARRAEPKGIPRAEVYNAVTWGAIGALIGARGFYVLGHIHQFTNIRDVIAVWQGGLTMFGGFLGGLVLGLWYLRRKGFPILPALDAAAPGFAIGVLIGRIGDIIIADHLGRSTHFFFGYKIPDAKLAPGYGPPLYVPGAVVHHTALYDFAGTLLLFLFLFAVERRDPPTGSLFATFATWYGLQRFLIDFTRNRTLIESHFFGLSGSQWAGLAFALGGVIALIRLRGRPRAVPAPTTPEPVAVPIAEPGGEMFASAQTEAVSSPPPLPTREEAFTPEPEPLTPAAPAAPEPPPVEPLPPTEPQPEPTAPAWAPETPPTAWTPETPPTSPTPPTAPTPATEPTPATPPTPSTEPTSPTEPTHPAQPVAPAETEEPDRPPSDDPEPSGA